MRQVIGMVVILSCLVLSVAAFMQVGGGGLNNLFKPNTIQQGGQADECKMKCGGSAGCEQMREMHAAGTIPPGNRADFWSWCSGVPSSTVPTTSKEKFGQACCPI